MTVQTTYICSRCGKEHKTWPALAYFTPTAYFLLTKKEKKEIARLDSDFCVIRYPDETNWFIRCTLTQKVIDHCEDLDYGLWVSLSESDFEDYSAHFKSENHQASYFGWLSNVLPDYQFKEAIPTTVITGSGDHRPQIVPMEDYDDPLVEDYYNGITKEEAERRIREMLDNC